jgi:hypothetical protein
LPGDKGLWEFVGFTKEKKKKKKKKTVFCWIRVCVSAKQTAGGEARQVARARAMGAPKQKWTQEEEDALRRGVLKHGAGKWRTIQKDPEFSPILSSRSNIDLKVPSPISLSPLLIYILRRGGARSPRLCFFSRVVCFFCCEAVALFVMLRTVVWYASDALLSLGVLGR